MQTKSLKFIPELVTLILNGAKRATWRLFDDKNLAVGDELNFYNKETGACFGKGVILKVREKQLGDIQKEDFIGHERFESEEKMYEAYRRYYGDRVTPETYVKLIEFSFVKI